MSIVWAVTVGIVFILWGLNAAIAVLAKHEQLKDNPGRPPKWTGYEAWYPMVRDYKNAQRTYAMLLLMLLIGKLA